MYSSLGSDSAKSITPSKVRVADAVGVLNRYRFSGVRAAVPGPKIVSTSPSGISSTAGSARVIRSRPFRKKVDGAAAAATGQVTVSLTARPCVAGSSRTVST